MLLSAIETGGRVGPSHYQCSGKKKNSCSYQKLVLLMVQSTVTQCTAHAMTVHFYKLVRDKAWYFMDICVRSALCAEFINGITVMWYQMPRTFSQIRQQLHTTTSSEVWLHGSLCHILYLSISSSYKQDTMNCKQSVVWDKQGLQQPLLHKCHLNFSRYNLY